MKTIVSILAALILVSTANASTSPGEVDRIDTAREGNLSKLVLADYVSNHKATCEEGLEVPKYEIMKISTSSAHQEKTENTGYDYEATYLIVQKCLYGSTYVGAYSDVKKSVIMKGSFTSKYNKKNGPLKMKDLKIELVKSNVL